MKKIVITSVVFSPFRFPHFYIFLILFSIFFFKIFYQVHTDRIFNTTNVIEYIFTICVRLRLPQEVKYSAALIFDKYVFSMQFSVIQYSTYLEDI